MNDRAAFQVLVLPYRQTSQGTEFALFRRADADCWQGVASGGEAGESPLQAARRETAEEAGLVGDCEFVALDARATIPVVHVIGEFTWGPDVLVFRAATPTAAGNRPPPTPAGCADETSTSSALSPTTPSSPRRHDDRAGSGVAMTSRYGV